MSNNTLYLIDSYAQIYRAYYAVKGLSTSSGKPSNAVFAIGKFILSVEKDYSPKLGAFVFDLGLPAKRLEIAPDYKANRPEMPDDLKQQLEPIKELIDAAGWNIIEKEGVEADDLIASLANKFNDNPIKIFSNDKDLIQIINDRVKLLITKPNQKGYIVRDYNNVVEKFNVKPEQMVDYLALIGDNSDNIPGINGVGPKTAVQLLKEYGNIHNLIQNLDQIKKENLKEKIKNNKDLLLKNIELVKLENNAEIESLSEQENLKLKSPKPEKLVSIAEEYELKSLSKEFEKVFKLRAPELGLSY